MAEEPEGRRSTWTDRVTIVGPWVSLFVLILEIIEEVIRYV